MYMTWIRISLENLHLTGTFTKLSSLNVKLLFSPPVYLYLSIIHIRLKLEKKVYRGLPVGFLLLRYSVLFTVESLSLLYLLVIS